VLKARGLTLWRGDHCLFNDLSFEVPKGRALALRGRNGAGKTTLLRVLCGLTRPEAGRVEWQGDSIEHQRAAFGSQLAWFGHATGLKADLTVRQNLEFAARLAGRPGADWQPLAGSLGLESCLDRAVRYLSAGQKRRTALTRVLMSGAAVWVMDEPFANLDDAGRDRLQHEMGLHLDAGGIAVVAVHHELRINGAEPPALMLGGSA